VAETKKTRSKADRKDFDADAEELGHGKVTELVHEHHDAEHDEHGEKSG